MHYITVSRNEFMSLLVQGKFIQSRLFNHSTYEKPHSGDVGLCWRDEGAFFGKDVSSPYIIVNDDEVLDFFAWVSSHFQSLNPITTYHHLVTYSTFLELMNEYVVDDVPELAWNALIGLSLGETYAMGANSNDFTPTLFNISTSFSYIIGRCVAAGYNKNIWSLAFDNWSMLRQFFGLSKSIMNFDRFYIYAHIIEKIIGSNEKQNINSCSHYINAYSNVPWISDKESEFLSHNVDFIYDIERIISEGFDTQEGLFQFSRMFDVPVTTRDFFSLPKEERYSSLKPVLSKIEIRDFLDEFVYAYLVNLISPGSFSQVDLFLAKHKEALPWYGLCAGLSSRTKIKNVFDFLGKRIYRDMARKEPFFSPPRCDMSCSEIFSIYKTKENLFDAVKSQRVNVEIVPNVDIVMSKISRQDNDSSESRQLKLFTEFLERLSGESSYLLDVLNEPESKLKPPRKRRNKNNQ